MELTTDSNDASALFKKCLGEWKPKQIKNPAYKGKWVHPEIDNPEYKEDKEIYAFEDFGRIGLDLWQGNTEIK